MVKLFEFSSAQPIFRAMGVTPGQTWDETRERIKKAARLQLQPRHQHPLKPETDSKWRTLRYLAENNG